MPERRNDQAAAQGREFKFIPVPSVVRRRCPYCKGTGHKQGPPLNHAPDTVVGVGYPKCDRCKGTGDA